MSLLCRFLIRNQLDIRMKTHSSSFDQIQTTIERFYLVWSKITKNMKIQT